MKIQDAERYFNDWGFDFIKIDYCGGQKQGLDEGMTTVSYLVTLKKGSNVITFGNPTEVISVVDCMTLKKVE